MKSVALPFPPRGLTQPEILFGPQSTWTCQGRRLMWRLVPPACGAQTQEANVLYYDACSGHPPAPISLSAKPISACNCAVSEQMVMCAL